MSEEGDGAPSALEESILRALSQADADLAVTLLLRGYGPEILRMLVAVHRSEEEASDVFALFAEGVWKGGPGFERRSSVRTWAYAIARRMSLRYRRDVGRHNARFRAFADDSGLATIEAKVRTETLSFLRTERRDKLVALREALPTEDQELLILRIDRRMSWKDLVLVLAGEADRALSVDEVKREAARLRKRFQLLKDRLRVEARRQGLIDEERDQ